MVGLSLYTSVWGDTVDTIYTHTHTTHTDCTHYTCVLLCTNHCPDLSAVSVTHKHTVETRRAVFL